MLFEHFEHVRWFKDSEHVRWRNLVAMLAAGAPSPQFRASEVVLGLRTNEHVLNLRIYERAPDAHALDRQKERNK